jgi:tRNA dimethylallyltransferase
MLAKSEVRSNHRMKLPLLVVAGPTGVGKTAAAVALAARVPLEVVSADSRQVYRFMDVATGKPTAAQRAAVPHHLVDIVDPDDRYQAARFRRDAVEAIADIHGRGRLPVVVGGTGLYIRALLRGLDPAPPADPEIRRELAAVAAREGRAALHARLAATAPAVAHRLHPNDHVRVIRALEKLQGRQHAAETSTGNGTWMSALDEERAWITSTGDDGTSTRSVAGHGALSAVYDVVYVGLMMARDALNARLAARAAAMAKAGLAEEVEALLARGYDPELPALHGIGYREFVRVVRGKLDAAAAVALMQRETVRYAKRQHTWFAREPGVRWLVVTPSMEGEDIAAGIEQRLREGRRP